MYVFIMCIDHLTVRVCVCICFVLQCARIDSITITRSETHCTVLTVISAFPHSTQ